MTYREIQTIAKDGSVKMGSDGEPKAKTSHSLNQVPGIIYDPEYKGEYDSRFTLFVNLENERVKALRDRKGACLDRTY